MKYHKNVLYLKPFVDEVKNLIPYRKITHIKGYKVKAGLMEQTDGSTLVDTDGTSTINVLLYTYNKKKKQHRPKPLHFILDTLAHELAHTVHWEHTYKHYELQAKLMIKFSKILKKFKIEDSSRSCKKELKVIHPLNRSDR